MLHDREAGPLLARICFAWDPIIFWSGRSWLQDELPMDWMTADMGKWEGFGSGNPVHVLCHCRTRDISVTPFVGT